MKNSKVIRGLATLAVCALALPVVGSLKNPTQRPFKVAGIYTPNPAGPGTFEVVGNATHLGNIVFPGTYLVVSVTPKPTGNVVTLHIHGTYTAANGDTIEVDCPDWVTDRSVTPMTSSGLVKIIGGTGRFAGASGSYIGNIYPAAFPGGPMAFTADGTISY